MTFGLTYFTPPSDIFIADFERGFASWELTNNSELYPFLGSNISA